MKCWFTNRTHIINRNHIRTPFTARLPPWFLLLLTHDSAGRNGSEIKLRTRLNCKARGYKPAYPGVASRNAGSIFKQTSQCIGELTLMRARLCSAGKQTLCVRSTVAGDSTLCAALKTSHHKSLHFHLLHNMSMSPSIHVNIGFK